MAGVPLGYALTFPNSCYSEQLQPRRIWFVALLPRVKFWKLLLQMHDFRRVVINNVGLIRMTSRVVLMVSLRGIERLQRHNLSHDRAREYFGLIELSDIGIDRGGVDALSLDRLVPVLRIACLRPLDQPWKLERATSTPKR